MQAKDTVDSLDFSGSEQTGMRNLDRIQGPFELLLPEREELEQFRKLRAQVVILPDISLKQRAMIRQPIENLRRRQPVAQHLFPEALGNLNPRHHANLHFRSALSGLATGSHPGDALTCEKCDATNQVITSQNV